MKLQTIKIDQISAGENIRKDITKESLVSLIASIKDKGILQPLLVRSNGGKFDLLDGYRRFSAAKHAELKEVPVICIDIEKDNRIEYQLVANLQRKDLNAMDEALAYKALGEDFAVKDIMVITGRPEYRIRRILALLTLCQEVKDMIKNGEISEDHGFVITRVQSPKFQKALATDIKRYRYSPSQAEGNLEHYSQRLEVACFDKKDCAKCAFNGSLMKDLFDKENSLNGKCLNADCFFKKIAEFQKVKEDEIKKTGKKVIVVKDEPQYGSKEYEAMKELVDFTGYEGQGFSKEQFQSECTKTCPTFAYIIGPSGQVKPVCLNAECFKRALRKAKAVERKATAIPKTGDPEKDASIQYESRQKENRVDFFKRDFFIKGLKEKISDKQLNRVLLHQLFSLESSGGDSIAELLKADKKQANYLMRDISRLWELSNDKLLSLIKQLVSSHLNDYDTPTLQLLGEEASFNIGKQFVITKEYLEKFTKAGLMKLSKELKLKIGSLVWKENKGEIIKYVLAAGCKGKVPKEMIK
jgi:ParB family chromosome partitioning protein